MNAQNSEDGDRAMNNTGLISLTDLNDEQLRALVRKSADYYERGITAHPVADGRIIGSYFAKTSTRTRAAFGSAVLRLGANLLTYGPDDLQLNTGESWDDTARTLGGMLDLLIMRTAGPIADQRRFSEVGRMPVVNAMATEEHPTQALADLTALQIAFGRIEQLTVSYVGEGNNTAAALAMALVRQQHNTVMICSPPGYGLDPATVTTIRASADPTSKLFVSSDIRDLFTTSDVVYTTRWQTTGTTKPDPAWHETFRPFLVDDTVMAHCPRARFMHDLPAHRGQEVTTSVLEGDRSLAWLQVQTKLTSAAAAVVHALTTKEPSSPPGRPIAVPRPMVATP